MKLYYKTSLLFLFFNSIFVDGHFFYRDFKNYPKHIRRRDTNADKNGEWKLRIIHTNDMHSRFNQTSKGSTDCSEKDARKQKCYGGFGRIATLVREIKATSPEPVLFLNAGDNFFGTPWFDIFRENITSELMNLLNPDAMSLGNHEFEHGPKELVSFINQVNFPVLAGNLDMSKEPELQQSGLLPYKILQIDGHQIGIIGYLTRETMNIAQVDNVVILDEIEFLRKHVADLKAQGVDIVIGLGHSGYRRDLEIAEAVEGLDLVIGGHTNTFLYNGAPPDSEKPEGAYPTIVEQSNGRKVYVVQAYAYTKYLGNLTVTFNAQGEVSLIEGNPILVDHQVPEAEDVVKALDKYRPKIVKLANTVIGKTKVPLDGPTWCKIHECNTGNLALDAMVDFRAKNFLGTNQWTDAAVAIMNSGMFKAAHKAHQEITMTDIYGIIAYDDIVGAIDFTGEQLIKGFEHSVFNITYEKMVQPEYVDGRFWQVSGIKIAFDLTKPGGSKVVPNSVYIRCANCSKPVYEPLVLNKTYKVLADDFLRRGEDGFTFIKDLPWTSYDVTMRKVFSSYVTSISPIYIGEENRITFIYPDKKSSDEVKENSESS